MARSSVGAGGRDRGERLPPPARADRHWAVGVSLVAVAITMAPYLLGATLQGARPALGWFSWFTFNATDQCVYLSWMRQAADGALHQRNLFTTEPQSGQWFSLFFLALGGIARLTGLPLTAVYQGARVVLAMALLHAVWWLLGMVVPRPGPRRAALLLVCFSAGLGWLPALWRRGFGGPVDTWQPEAVTFLSLYLFPLFLVSQLLMVGVLGFLLKGERTGRARWAAAAGACGSLLGNIHTYDVITLALVWTVYLAARSVRDRRVDPRSWGRAALAGAMTAVSTGQMLWVYRTELVFARRVAVPTLSPPIGMVLLGFGLVLLLAALGLARRPTAGADGTTETRADRLFLGAWAAANVGAAYLPVAFQRKMLMGAHLPLAILGGIGLAWLVERAMPARLRVAALTAAVALTAITNARFLARDMARLPENPGPVRSYLFAGEVAALEWVRSATPPGTPVQPLPWVALDAEGRLGFFDNSLACYTPGIAGRPVNAGHWGETPDFSRAMNRWARFLAPDTTDAWRRGLLRESGVHYLVFSQKREETRDPRTAALVLTPFLSSPRPYLRLVPGASSADADVYEVAAP